MKAPSNGDDLLAARGISKAFPGVQALEDVDLSVRGGEVLAVVGENGAGKSTLMKILAGVVAPDGGELRIDGRLAQVQNVHDAEQNGIVLIHQELNLAENLDVAANLFLGREPCWGGPLRLIDRRIYRDAAELMTRVGLEGSPREFVGSLPVGRRQLVEIARALSLRSRVLIMDEPTSSLTQRETARLFDVIRSLKKSGVSIVYISHRLQEVEEIADRVTVLRDGCNAGELPRAEISHDAMVRLMVGRELKQFFHRTRGKPIAQRDPHHLLEVEGLRITSRTARPISFHLEAGEIVGMAGLMGSGRTRLAQTLFGARLPQAGDVRVAGRRLSLRRPWDAIDAGVFLVPEDRRRQGLVLSASIRHNVALPSLDRLQSCHMVSFARERELVDSMCRQLNVVATSPRQILAKLSGGNQQKVVLGKWLSRGPRVLILDEPTRGVDVGAKAEIYELMDRLSGQGMAVLMISSDLEEILGMSDRVLVMHGGELAGGLAREEMTEEAIMHLATGGDVAT